jgi:hypothetical protein
VWKVKPGLCPNADSGMLASGSISWELLGDIYHELEDKPVLEQTPAAMMEKVQKPQEQPSEKEVRKKKQDIADTSDLSSSSSSSSASDNEVQQGRAPVIAADSSAIEWFLQRKKTHLLCSITFEEGRNVPWCRDEPFAQDSRCNGVGLEEVEYTDLCTRCLARCSPDMKKAIVKHFSIM